MKGEEKVKAGSIVYSFCTIIAEIKEPRTKLTLSSNYLGSVDISRFLVSSPGPDLGEAQSDLKTLPEGSLGK